jgi:hypothetical protein
MPHISLNSHSSCSDLASVLLQLDFVTGVVLARISRCTRFCATPFLDSKNEIRIPRFTCPAHVSLLGIVGINLLLLLLLLCDSDDDVHIQRQMHSHPSSSAFPPCVRFHPA